MQIRRKAVITAIILAATVFGSVFSQALEKSVLDTFYRMGVGITKAPVDPADFELIDIEGDVHRLSSYHGKVVFLNFWATWCGPCRSEMPSMQRLYDELRAEGLEILAVDLQETTKDVRRFADEYGLTFPLLMDTTGVVGGRYGARSIPTTYLIDRNGKIFAGSIGARQWDTPEMISAFRRVLREGVEW